MVQELYVTAPRDTARDFKAAHFLLSHSDRGRRLGRYLARSTLSGTESLKSGVSNIVY